MTELLVDDLEGEACWRGGGIPDLRWVNRHLPMRDVCAALGLRLGPGAMIHCWHSEQHKAGDRTPSVSICKSTNRLRCFGCGSTTLTVIDVVMDAQQTDVAGAVRWLQQHFDLKYISKGQHLKDKHAIRPYHVGHEKPIELLIKSGIEYVVEVDARYASYLRLVRLSTGVIYRSARSSKGAGFLARLEYKSYGVWKRV